MAMISPVPQQIVVLLFSSLIILSAVNGSRFKFVALMGTTLQESLFIKEFTKPSGGCCASMCGVLPSCTGVVKTKLPNNQVTCKLTEHTQLFKPHMVQDDNSVLFVTQAVVGEYSQWIYSKWHSRYFRLFTKPKNWEAARSQCNTFGDTTGYLTLRSDQEYHDYNNHVAKLLGVADAACVGAKHRAHDSQQLWIHYSGAFPNNLSAAVAFPSQRGLQCYKLNTQGEFLNLNDCSDMTAKCTYVCEKEF